MQSKLQLKDSGKIAVQIQEQQILLQLANILKKQQLLTPDEEARLVQKIRSEVQ